MFRFGVIATFLGILMVVIFFLAIRFGNPFKSPGIFVDTSRASVVQEMRQLQRLETASFTIEKVIEAGTDDQNVFQSVLYGDKILLIAHGQVIAGFDLGTLEEKDIDVEGKSITLRLPAPQILVTSVDNQKTKVYDRSQGLFSKGNKDLESEARQKAELSIKDAACAAGILDQASENARKQLGVLLTGLGFINVNVQVASGSC